ncbi:MAG: Gfo/Idh/MocA family oxidoreductase [Absicoccus sp.]|uniref:Gfo/Idh/MocA family oxidoreductase n=1 Tax=Absicoccus intestinalis TaxID=2926319 RepID=A0ABU4WPX8_9FIRM|nr:MULTISPECIES: Gfo/Idh/MocA family oxidoreductase [unclassified Absicoccus]MDX8418106.1 Gfo/Idh/MocA family oxidoreductase [Absicoccus sp. CLA-KB-P134]MDY3035510.1 Gfo/Idh/MocA family oxidoreductase [Absicoccus sp.]
MKVAMIGTGFIVHEALKCINDLPIDVGAIYAKHNLQAAKQLQAQYQIPHVYSDYDQLLQETDCDVIYIGLVNTAHYSYAKKALLADKHVIIEKPFCINAKQSKEIITLAKQKHVFVFEAVRPLHTPNYQQLREDIHKIGQIKCIQCNYSQYSSRYDRYKKQDVLPALDPKFYGGALYDINVYNLNFVVSLFGKPDTVSYHANIGFNGVDTSGTVLLTYPDFYAVCTGAKDAESPAYAIIQGDHGTINLDGGANLIQGYHLCIRNQEIQDVYLNTQSNWMAHEFLDFKEMLETNNVTKMESYLEISQNVMETLDQAIATIPYGQRKQ